MGSFITNLHIRDVAPHAVIEALKSLRVVPAYVRGSPADAWTSIFPQAAFQDEAGLRDDLTLVRTVHARQLRVPHPATHQTSPTRPWTPPSA
ncbi:MULTISPECIES: hypothetical protein [unclassified Bradyrhizobium]|uniref:hypothetical protein n=1 Tax=Bradyrhizobium TaxID=374 RepID=UPI0028F15ED2|nr:MULTISPECIES: hypothetical protein [unclassified Bradyrhizobium]